jgi:hypothetical protein
VALKGSCGQFFGQQDPESNENPWAPLRRIDLSQWGKEMLPLWCYRRLSLDEKRRVCPSEIGYKAKILDDWKPSRIEIHAMNAPEAKSP